MSRRKRWCLGVALVGFSSLLLGLGCQAFSNKMTKWKMLDQAAVEQPLQAVGGDGIVFGPKEADRPMSRSQLAAAAPQALVAYYTPIFIQQRIDASKQRFPYPPEYDYIGEAQVTQEKDGKFKALVAGQPKVYAIYQQRKIGQHDHVQLTYTAWYPAHPRMKAVDVEEAEIDSCVVRVTLDDQNAPLFYETIAACGCFHKVFVTNAIEEGAARIYGGPEKGNKFVVERTVPDAIAWEVAGVVDESRDQPRRPVVFIKAGDHKVIGMGSASRLRVPANAEVHQYELTSYDELYAVRVANGGGSAPFFDMKSGGKVWGAQRKERFIFSIIGVDDAGHPRANDQIKLHFDQSTWDDTTIYEKYLRLPPGTL
jgi:hypothetical protein